jgi:hypothetical protein
MSGFARSRHGLNCENVGNGQEEETSSQSRRSTHRKNKCGTTISTRLPQARYDSFEQHTLIAAHFAPLFVTRHFLKLRGLAGRAA